MLLFSAVSDTTSLTEANVSSPTLPLAGGTMFFYTFVYRIVILCLRKYVDFSIGFSMTFATSPAGAGHQTCFSKTMLRTSGPDTEPSCGTHLEKIMETSRGKAGKFWKLNLRHGSDGVFKPGSLEDALVGNGQVYCAEKR